MSIFETAAGQRCFKYMEARNAYNGAALSPPIYDNSSILLKIRSYHDEMDAMLILNDGGLADILSNI